MVNVIKLNKVYIYYLPRYQKDILYDFDVISYSLYTAIENNKSIYFRLFLEYCSSKVCAIQVRCVLFKQGACLKKIVDIFSPLRFKKIKEDNEWLKKPNLSRSDVLAEQLVNQPIFDGMEVTYWSSALKH